MPMNEDNGERITANLAMARRLAFGDDTMRVPVKRVVNRLYTFHPSAEDAIGRRQAVARKRDGPELDASLLTAVDRS